MVNPLTYLNSLFDAFAEKTLSGHDQLICLHIFNKFNRARWPETVRISDRELQELCRLYDSTGKPVTVKTIRNAKSRLKLKGLIDFKAGSGDNPTEYHLINPFHPPKDTPFHTPGDTYKYISNNESLNEDLRLKTKDNPSFIQSARTRETSERVFINA